MNTLARLYLSDGSNRWIDPDQCQRWDGHGRHPQIYETLFRTPAGTFILRRELARSAASPMTTLLSAEAATLWLLQNGYDDRSILIEANAHGLHDALRLS